MAWESPILDLSYVAEEDMSEAHIVVVLGTNDSQVKLPDAITDLPFGVIQDSADSGESVDVRVEGVTKVVANGAFSKNDLLSIAATTGRVDTATAIDDSWGGTTVHAIGLALEAATAAGQKVPMLIRPIYYGT